MSPSLKKVIGITLLFAFWLGTDLWSKHWADTTLADPFHPQAVRITAAEVGKTLREVVQERLELPDGAELDKILSYATRLPDPLKADAGDPLFSDQGEAAKARGFYVFWRGNIDLPPRRIDKKDRSQLIFWGGAASPGVALQEINAAVDAQLADITVQTWMASRIRRLTESSVPEVLAQGRAYSVTGTSRTAPSGATVAEGDVFLLRWRQVDVMGDWWKYTYAENTGAAFGFLKSVPRDLREIIFGVLTLVVLGVILSIVWRTPPQHRLIHAAMSTVLAGAMGNFVDRIRYGYVIDFIDMDLGFMRWPTYNIADIAIGVGVGLLILEILIHKDSPLVAEPDKSVAEAPVPTV